MSLYFDYNATTPVDSQVVRTITETLNEAWANPSSASPAGRKAKQIIEQARQQVAAVIDAPEQDILFTSGGTESNHTVLHSIIQTFHDSHVVISAAEHPSVQASAQAYSDNDKLQVSYAPLQPSGQLDVEGTLALITPNTRLVSVMLVQNETGVIMDIAQLTKALRQYEVTRSLSRIYVHVDAAQAIGKLRVQVNQLDVDYLTIAGHKFYGPRVGALYVRGLATRQTPLVPIFLGGGQERGLRAGTENTAMLAGLGKACFMAQELLESTVHHMRMLQQLFETNLRLRAPPHCQVLIHGEETNRVSNTTYFSIVPMDTTAATTTKQKVEWPSSNDLVTRLAQENIYVSAGSACHSGSSSNNISGVLRAMQVPESIGRLSIRFSTGRDTQVEHIDDAIHAIWKIFQTLVPQ
ncbi:pyridoxal phosphate-dependent transferase [Syncephalis plumigaleata]|nr:pyridoxal phosphate-dependent transferase [Syncephalis plumigaleata]